MVLFTWSLGSISVFIAPTLVDASELRLEKLADPPSPIEVADVFIASNYNPFKGDAPQYDQHFLSGTGKLEVVIIFKKTPPDGTNVTYEAKGPAGKVGGSGMWMSYGNGNTPGLTVWTDLESKVGFADGAYQVVIGIDGTSVYRLNWTIGPKGTSPKSNPKGKTSR